MYELDKLFKSEHNDDWKIEYIKTRFFTKDEEPFSLEAYLKVEDDASQLIKNNMRKLYKYCSFDENNYSLDNLFKFRVYLKNPNKFNDPFDSLFSINIDRDILINEVLNTLGKRIKINNDELLQMIDVTMSEQVINECNSYRNRTWVTCFSEVYDSILMWSHYGDNHKGFCIEYDFSKTTQYFYLLSPVLYIDKLYYINEHVYNGKGLHLCSLLKSFEWKYEKEWRLVICNLEGDSAEFLNTPKPTAIYLGACSEWDKRIIDFAEQSNIKVYKLRMSTEEYKLMV